jgi:hypothetical protein
MIDPKKVEEFLLMNQKVGKAPAWLAGLPPVNGRVAGPWRGPGSFGRGFGPQVRHK